MAGRLCDVCGARPATVAIRRIVPGGGQRIEHLCDVHAARARGGSSSFGGGSLFDDFFNQFFEATEGSGRSPSGGEAAAPRAEQVDVTRFFSDSTNELLQRAGGRGAGGGGAAHVAPPRFASHSPNELRQRAAGRAMEWGSADLAAEHLLHAALEDGMA